MLMHGDIMTTDNQHADSSSEKQLCFQAQKETSLPWKSHAESADDDLAR